MWTQPQDETSNCKCVAVCLFVVLQLYCPSGISPMGNSDCFPRGMPAATESRYPAYGACWVFYCFHNPPNFDMDYRIFNVRTDVNACDCTRECTYTRKRVCTRRPREKNPSPHRGIEPASGRDGPTLYQLSYIPILYVFRPTVVFAWGRLGLRD